MHAKDKQYQQGMTNKVTSTVQSHTSYADQGDLIESTSHTCPNACLPDDALSGVGVKEGIHLNIVNLRKTICA